jgi:hypothetical protein
VSKPIPMSFEERLRDLKGDVERMKLHSHPGLPKEPIEITGSLSDPATLGQLLDALEAAGYLTNSTTP